MIEHLVDHGEFVVAAQVAVEIDVAGKNIGDLDGDVVREAGRIGGGEKRTADLAGLHLPLRRERELLLDRLEFRSLFVEADQPAIIGDIAQREQAAVFGGARLYRGARAQQLQ